MGDAREIRGHGLGSNYLYSGAQDIRVLSRVPSGAIRDDTVDDLQALWHFRRSEIRTIIETIHVLVVDGGESWLEVRRRLNPKGKREQ